MEYKSYYYKEYNTVLVTKEKEQPSYEDIKLTDLKINIEKKDVSQIYVFFKSVTIEAILENKNKINFDFTNIESESFYQDTAFKKLLELFEDTIEQIELVLNKVIS